MVRPHPHACTHTRTHARTHARTNAGTPRRKDTQTRACARDVGFGCSRRLALRSAGAGRAGSCPTPPRSAWQAPPSPDRGVRACPTGWWGVPTNALGRAASGASEAGYGVPQCGSRTASLRWAAGGGAAPTGAHGGHRQMRARREKPARTSFGESRFWFGRTCSAVRARARAVPLMRLAIPFFAILSALNAIGSASLARVCTS